MTGIEELRDRAAALRWLHDLPIWREPLTQDHLRALADMLEWSADTVARDYAEPAEDEPAEPENDPAEEPGGATRAEPAPTPQPPRRGPASTWTDEQLAELRRRFQLGETAKEIAEAMGLDAEGGGTKRVANKLFALGLRRSSVPLPNPAERQLAEDAAQAAVADADIATIRHWLETKGGVKLAPDTPALMVLKHANDARRRFGLPPFRLVRRPSEPTQDELARMTRAGEHHA